MPLTFFVIPGRAPEPVIGPRFANPESRNRTSLPDSGSARSKSAVADLDNDIAELG
jgi:hypothetical protein